jgi:pyruvate carboxylase
MPVANLNLVAVYQVHSPSRAEDMPMRFKKLMVANRSEIAIRVFRTAHELGLRTVAVYSHEDRFALHRFKADEAYKVGKAGEPIRSYLDIEALVDLAVANGVDAIHPGYGFLSENARFAKAVRAAGIAFVGPRTDILEHLGDKVIARGIADKAGVPILAGSSRWVVADAGCESPIPQTNCTTLLIRPDVRQVQLLALLTCSWKNSSAKPGTSRCN